jgi:hypothetical protein
MRETHKQVLLGALYNCGFMFCMEFIWAYVFMSFVESRNYQGSDSVSVVLWTGTVAQGFILPAINGVRKKKRMAIGNLLGIPLFFGVILIFLFLVFWGWSLGLYSLD